MFDVAGVAVRFLRLLVLPFPHNSWGFPKYYTLYTQRYTMADQYEHVNLGEFNVVRSTQFVEDFARGVHDVT